MTSVLAPPVEYSRRQALLVLGGFAVARTVNASHAIAQSAIPRFPRQEALESGDLLWSADPEAKIYFSDADMRNRKSAWQSGKDELVARLAASQDATERDAARRISGLDLDRFETEFLQDRREGDNIPFSGGGVSVGHVAIVEKTIDGQLWIIEADPRIGPGILPIGKFTRGVIREPYVQWADLHAGKHVWHGRIGGYDVRRRSDIASAATQYVGRDYNLFNLDMGSREEFYCSKLAWVAIWDALHIAIDGNTRQRRGFWLTPKALYSLEIVQKLHVPRPM